MITFADRKGGFPHSEMSGSKGARASPDLIAACHVLHRLSTPRHPSEALMRLIVLSKTHAWDSQAAARTCALYLPDNDVFSGRLRYVSRRRANPSIHDVIDPLPSPIRAKREAENLILPIAPQVTRSGGARRDRTDDLMLAKHALYQLSYGPIRAARTPLGVVGSCRRPLVLRPRETHSNQMNSSKCGGPRQTRTADLTLIRRVL
jgi:hypothetical protein